jgi:O-antigen ligase
LLVVLPWVVAFSGLDKFRLPKSAVAMVGILILATSLVAVGKLRCNFGRFSWESLLLVAIVYVGAHSLIFGRSPASWVGLFTLAVYFFLFVSFISLADPRFQRRIWLWIGAVFGANAILTVIQFYGLLPQVLDIGGQVLRGRLTPAGLLGEVNSGGFLFGLVALIMVYYLVAENDKRLRLLAAVFLGLNVLGLAYTRTLTAVIGLIACSLVWLVFHHWWILRFERETARRSLGKLWLAIGFSLVLGLVVGREAGLSERLVSVWSLVQKGEWSIATAGRQPVFQLTGSMISEKPFTGRGLNSFGEDFFYYKAESEAGQSVRLLSQPGAFREVHNEYLQVWAEIGLPGLLLFLSLFAIPVLRSVVILREEQDGPRGYWIGILTIGLIFVSVDCLAFFPFHVSVTAFYIVFLLACLRFFQNPSQEESRIAAMWTRRNTLVAVAGLLLLTVGVGYVQARKWTANRQLEVVAFLLERASAGTYTAAQKRVFADEALSRLEAAEAVAALIPEVHNLKGSAFMTVGRYPEAIENYQKAAQRIPSPEVLTNLAAAFIANRQFGKAEDAVTLALRYEPAYPKALGAREYLESVRE